MEQQHSIFSSLAAHTVNYRSPFDYAAAAFIRRSAHSLVMAVGVIYMQDGEFLAYRAAAKGERAGQ